ncbi:hypothetical protein ACA910_002073 [Epithemia clementina (nom. ined.)]
MMRKIEKGTLVDVKPDTSINQRQRPSEGGIGFVQQRKKALTSNEQSNNNGGGGAGGDENNINNNNNINMALTQDSNATTMTAATTYDVRYSLDGRLSQDVEKSRVSVAMLGTTTLRRPGSNSSNPSFAMITTTTGASSTNQPQLGAQSINSPPLKKYSHPWLLQCMDERIKNGERKHIRALQYKKKNDTSGWLRRLETLSRAEAENKKTQLTDVEKKKAMDLFLACKPHMSAAPLVAYAWGVDERTIHRVYQKMLQHPDASTSWKKRSDAGKKLFNNENKQRSIYTPKFVFAKLLRRENPDATFTKQQIDVTWDEATQQTHNDCGATAEEWITQGPFLLMELTKALSSTRGSVSWRTVATLIAGSGNLEMISATTIRNFVMSLPESTYTSTKRLPKLDRSNKQRRLWWAQQFWIFFESSKQFNNLQIVLVPMDKKWFWSIVVRRNLKCVPVLGIEPVQHGIQHKSHIEKTMGIASTAFVPTNNNMEFGGSAHLVSLTRVGQMMKATRDTYKHVYSDNGTYHYPKRAANLLRVKGLMYFRNLEITGSNKGTAKDPKFDLLPWFATTEIPALEQLCAKVESGLGKRCVVRYQMDGAGPHQDTTLNEFLGEELGQRGWLLKFQPSNSPITNVKDDCLFPALSKHVSREQGITKGSQVFCPDELWIAVKKCWKNFPMDALARGYVRHGQMASALIACDGGDDFVRKRGGLHCNVRNCCATVCDENGEPTGVEVLSCFDDSPDNGSGDGGENHNSDTTQQQKTLRYKKPDVGDQQLKENLF